MICNLGVVGSNPTRGSKISDLFGSLYRKQYMLCFKHMGEFQSGQMGQTVNLLSFDFGGSNPSSPTKLLRVLNSDSIHICGSSSVDRASAFQAEGRGFEPRLPLFCCYSSVVEHFLGREEVLGSSPSNSSQNLKS